MAAVKYNALDFVGKTAEEITVMLGEVRAEVKTSTVNGLKVSEKGGLSVYGLGRFPVTLYASQWLNLLDKRDEIVEFIAANGDRLKSKPEKQSVSMGDVGKIEDVLGEVLPPLKAAVA